MVPSTRCKSFDAHPAGLNVSTAFVPFCLHTISIVPYCSIHILPTITLCTQQFTFDHEYDSFHFSSSTVTMPFGWISTLLPQNFNFGWIEPVNLKSGESAWNADTGGWCETCSHTIRKSSFWYSYVSPSNGLNGFPKRSQFDASAETAKPVFVYRFVQQKKMCECIINKWFAQSLYGSCLSHNSPETYFNRSMGSSCSAAVRNRRAYSMYSVIRCRNVNGSLNTTGIVILLNSLPIQFFKTDHRLKSWRETIGEGNTFL